MVGVTKEEEVQITTSTNSCGVDDLDPTTITTDPSMMICLYTLKKQPAIKDLSGSRFPNS